MKTPSPIDLKPLLDRAIAEFPGCKIELHFALFATRRGDVKLETNYDTRLTVDGVSYCGPSFEFVLQAAQYDFPLQQERISVANALRKKADQIERGEVAI